MTVTEWSPAEIAHLGANGDAKPRQPKAEKTHSWQPVDLLGAALNPPAPPSIEGIVYPGRRHVFSGEPESLKSWALMCLYVGEMNRGRNVIHVDLEMGAAEIGERLLLLGATHDQLATQFTLLEPSDPMTHKDTLPYVRAMLALRQPSIVGVDAFTGALLLHGCDPNSGTEVERFYRTVADELRATGAAFIVLDHLSKNKDARGKFAIGSERKIGAADCHYSFEVQKTFGRGEHGKAAITVKKDRPGHIARDKAIVLDLFSSPENGRIKYVWHFEKKVIHPHGNFRPTAYMERISRYLAECVTPPSAAEAELAAGGKSEWARLATQILLRDGFVKEGKNEHGERTLKSLRRYVESEDEASDKYVAPKPIAASDFAEEDFGF